MLKNRLRKKIQFPTPNKKPELKEKIQLSPQVKKSEFVIYEEPKLITAPEPGIILESLSDSNPRYGYVMGVNTDELDGYCSLFIPSTIKGGNIVVRAVLQDRLLYPLGKFRNKNKKVYLALGKFVGENTFPPTDEKEIFFSDYYYVRNRMADGSIIINKRQEQILLNHLSKMILGRQNKKYVFHAEGPRTYPLEEIVLSLQEKN